MKVITSVELIVSPEDTRKLHKIINELKQAYTPEALASNRNLVDREVERLLNQAYRLGVESNGN